jgi:lipoprotein-releasing system permease protein
MDKTNDIKTLQNLGANRDLISKIFVFEGLLISLSGAVLGIICGTILILFQKHYHLIKLGKEGSFLIDYYPVKLMPMDFLYVFATILVIGLVSAVLPVKMIMRKT